jgi:hypothetical protein
MTVARFGWISDSASNGQDHRNHRALDRRFHRRRSTRWKESNYPLRNSTTANGRKATRAQGKDNQRSRLLRIQRVLFRPARNSAAAPCGSSINQIRPHPATRHVIKIEVLRGPPSGKRTSKLPHRGTASCLMMRMRSAIARDSAAAHRRASSYGLG